MFRGSSNALAAPEFHTITAIDDFLQSSEFATLVERQEPNVCFHATSGCSKDGSNAGVTAMKEVFDELLKFLHQGISAIFHFVELIWTWSVGQIGKLIAVPWQEGRCGSRFCWC